MQQLCRPVTVNEWARCKHVSRLTVACQPSLLHEALYHVLSRRFDATVTARPNPLWCKGNYSATSNNMKLVHRPLMGGLLHLVQRGEDWAGPQPTQAPPRCTKCNNPSPASVPITVLLYNGPLLCGFNAPLKG